MHKIEDDFNVILAEHYYQAHRMYINRKREYMFTFDNKGRCIKIEEKSKKKSYFILNKTLQKVFYLVLLFFITVLIYYTRGNFETRSKDIMQEVEVIRVKPTTTQQIVLIGMMVVAIFLGAYIGEGEEVLQPKVPQPDIVQEPTIKIFGVEITKFTYDIILYVGQICFIIVTAIAAAYCYGSTDKPMMVFPEGFADRTDL